MEIHVVRGYIGKYLCHTDCTSKQNYYIGKRKTKYICINCGEELLDPFYLTMLMFNLVRPCINPSNY